MNLSSRALSLALLAGALAGSSLHAQARDRTGIPDAGITRWHLVLLDPTLPRARTRDGNQLLDALLAANPGRTFPKREEVGLGLGMPQRFQSWGGRYEAVRAVAVAGVKIYLYTDANDFVNGEIEALAIGDRDARWLANAMLARSIARTRFVRGGKVQGNPQAVLLALANRLGTSDHSVEIRDRVLAHLAAELEVRGLIHDGALTAAIRATLEAELGNLETGTGWNTWYDSSKAEKLEGRVDEILRRVLDETDEVSSADGVLGGGDEVLLADASLAGNQTGAEPVAGLFGQ